MVSLLRGVSNFGVYLIPKVSLDENSIVTIEHIAGRDKGLYIYIYMCVYVYVLSNASTRTRCDKRLLFKRILTALNSVFLLVNRSPFQG